MAGLEPTPCGARGRMDFLTVSILTPFWVNPPNSKLHGKRKAGFMPCCRREVCWADLLEFGAKLGLMFGAGAVLAEVLTPTPKRRRRIAKPRRQCVKYRYLR